LSSFRFGIPSKGIKFENKGKTKDPIL